jgi:integrase
MPQLRYSKTDHRYWIPKVFKAAATYNGKRLEAASWSIRLRSGPNRTTFVLDTSNREAAAARARDIYLFLRANGWEATLSEFKEKSPVSIPAPAQTNPDATLGEFLTELKTVADLKPKTLEGYAISLRTIASQIFAIDGGNKRYDYRRGGRDKWIAKVHAVKLAELTPAKIQKWKRDFITRAGSDPVKLRTARISVNSLIRRSKSLFAPGVIKHLQRVRLPSPLPFENIAFEPRVSQRYQSAIDIKKLIAAARTELQPTKPELFKVFVLATFCGLRRLEIDRLTWSAFHFDEAFLRVEATKYFSPKTEDAIGEVPLELELVELFRGYQARASDEFVIESPNLPRLDATFEYYRCQALFESLITWLRHKGVKTKTPLHTLRKEYGSLINKNFGLHAASVALRHANIAVTSLHYVDSRPRATAGLGALLSDKVTTGDFSEKQPDRKPKSSRRRQSST